MRLLRRLSRLFALGFVAATAGADYLLFARHRRNAASRARWLQRHCRRALRALAVRVAPVADAPSAPAFVVANHLSYVDILVLADATPLVFVAKRAVRDWPVWGWLARAGGTCFVNREQRGDVARAGSEISAAIDAGATVAIFCEGTSSGGSRVLPFKSALLQPAVDAKTPVTPAALNYAVPAPHSAATEVCWWGDMDFAPHLWNLLGLPGITAQVAWGCPLHIGEDRKRLASRLHDEVSILHRTLVAGHRRAPLPAVGPAQPILSPVS
jgi:lyso-ornithine lipid O-acyltransferase